MRNLVFGYDMRFGASRSDLSREVGYLAGCRAQTLSCEGHVFFQDCIEMYLPNDLGTLCLSSRWNVVFNVGGAEM